MEPEEPKRISDLEAQGILGLVLVWSEPAWQFGCIALGALSLLMNEMFGPNNL